MTARPFVKAVGGKGDLLEPILALLPKRITGTYREPFVGGGAVFWELHARGVLKSANAVMLGDANHHLMIAYDAVKSEPEAVIERLEGMRNTAADYARERALFNTGSGLFRRSAVEQAAAFIYLNKLCFNGLFRVSRTGKFNVGYCKDERTKFLDAPNLRACSDAMNSYHNGRPILLLAASWERSLTGCERGDVVYLDPPYVPASPTASFAEYTAAGFSRRDHEKLAGALLVLDRAGVRFVLSNSDTPFTRKLYEGFRIVETSRSGSMNSDGAKRGRVGELLVTNTE